ncbi:hypothetical protein ACES2L_06135 [Bdellovibrio bacteriovorus]
MFRDSENEGEKPAAAPQKQMKVEFLALWGRKDRLGNTIYTGKLNNASVIAFYTIDKKPGDPDIKIYLTDREDKKKQEHKG